MTGKGKRLLGQKFDKVKRKNGRGRIPHFNESANGVGMKSIDGTLKRTPYTVRKLKIFVQPMLHKLHTAMDES